MGGSNSVTRSRRSSTASYNRKSDNPDVIRKIDEKECVFIAMQSEIDKAITENNTEVMKSLLSEIAAHIMDLNQLKQVELSSTNRGRTQKIIYNFELSLAKLKSISNYNTAMKKERDRHFFSDHSSSSFYVSHSLSPVEPDIVSDLIRFDSLSSVNRSPYLENRNTLPNVPENEATHHTELTRSNSLYTNQKAQNFEEEFALIESEFDVLQDQALRAVEDVSEYYQMDKGIFYLYVKLKNMDLPENSELNERKVKLTKELADFRNVLDKKSGELEEQREIAQEVSTLELLLDSASRNEIPSLKTRALALQGRIERSSWNPYLIEGKVELLKRLARFMERVAFASPSSSSITNSFEHLYGNLQHELKTLYARENKEVSDVSTEYPSNNLNSYDGGQEEENAGNSNVNDELIYGNVETIRQNLESNLFRNVRRLDGSAVEEPKQVPYNSIEVPNNNLSHEDDREEGETEENGITNNEEIYGNVEIIKQNWESKKSRNLQRVGSSASQRGTLYVNADVVKQNSPYENHSFSFENGMTHREVIAKRPLPLPRNYDDKIINDLPKHWLRLNEIFEKESFTDMDRSEVEEIQRHAEVAKNLFERKIKRIVEKFEDSVEL